MSGKPWLTIVVPAYNVEKYLVECIESIETYSDDGVQVIVVDDGSTDRTPGISDSLALVYENLTVIHRENGGSPSARNAGFEQADGNWVWFVDSDDVISPYALESLRVATASLDCDAVQIQFLRFANGDVPVWPTATSAENAEILTSNDFLRGLYAGKFPHYMWSFLLRSDALRGRNEHTTQERSRNDHHGWPFREDFSLYEDVVSVEELVRKFKTVKILPEKLYGYRQIGSSMTHKRSNSAAESGLRAVSELRNYDVPAEMVCDKQRMELSLLFSAYKLVENNDDAPALKIRFDSEIRSRVKLLGVFRLGSPRLIRYVLYSTGFMDRIIDWRNRG